jgi:uncharacterized membrane protein YccC
VALRGNFSAWRDRLLASDPGLSRFRFAARVALSAVLALLVLVIFTQITHQGLPVMLLGVVVGVLTAVTVNDPEPKQQRLTTLLLPLSAATAVTLGALLSSSRYLGDAGFVGVMFAAVYIRRFGPRGFALGMLAFIPYFFALFLKVKPETLPWMFTAILLGTLCSYLMRFAIMPEHPEARLRRILKAFQARVGQVVDAAVAVLAGTEERRGALRRLSELNDAAFMVGGQLNTAPLRSRAEENDLLVKVFDLELAAQRLATASTDDIPAAAREQILPALRELQRVLRGRGGALEPDRLQDLPKGRLGLAVRDLAAAVAAIPTYDQSTDERQPRPDQHRVVGGQDIEEQEERDNTDNTTEPDKEGRKGLRPSTRQAIQVSLAGALAIAGGEVVSPTRWYWAAITSFIVFTGTNSRGDVLVKSWQRMLGTFAGVIAGVFVATVVRGNQGVSIPLVLMCIFLAFYSFRVSYALMIFWITILLALLYGLLGSFTPHLLLLRLEETALGAAAGVLVAVWVLPTRTRTEVVEASQAFLSALGSVLDGFADRANPLTPQLRELDSSLQKLRAAAAPLTRGIGGALGRSSVRRWLRELEVCRYEAQSLAQLLQHGSFPEDVLEMLSETASRVRDNIRALMLLAEEREAATLRPVHEPVYRMETALSDRGPASARALAAAHRLKCLDQIVRGLARDFYPERSKVQDQRLKVED